MRRKTIELNIGGIRVGGDAPISVQSMTNTDTRDVAATLRQIEGLQKAGCEIVRLAVPDETAARAIGAIKKDSPLPLIADIHFDYRLALLSLEGGIDALRINPGNIGSRDKVEKIVERCRDRKIPIRIGVNGGSLEKSLLEKYGGITSDALVESALGHIHILEDLDYPYIKVSLKSSHVPMMVEAYEKLGDLVPYPFHIGVTEAGTLKNGLIKSGVGIGILLSKGLGDTLRVSLTDDPVEEVKAGYSILRALELRQTGATLVSCPTCGRTEIDLIGLAQKVEKIVEDIKVPITVAVMGCPVNGPGEARNADIGIAGGKNKAVIFRKGEVIETVDEAVMFDRFKAEIEKTIKDYEEEKS